MELLFCGNNELLKECVIKHRIKDIRDKIKECMPSKKEGFFFPTEESFILEALTRLTDYGVKVNL